MQPKKCHQIMRLSMVAGFGVLLTLILAGFWFHSPTKPFLPPVFRGYTNDAVGRRFAAFHMDGDRRLLSTVYIIEEFHGRRSIRVGAITNSHPVGGSSKGDLLGEQKETG